jgi:hypothetical protein
MMMVKAITASDPVCFGVCCDAPDGKKHCTRYQRVETAPDDVTRINWCSTDHGATFPLFVMACRPEPEAVSA